MDIIGLKLSYLLAVYATLVLTVVSVQYCCLRKSMAFIIAWEGLAGMVGFGLSATYYSLTAMPLAKLIALGGLGLLVGSLSSLLLYHLPPPPSRRKQHALVKLPLLIALITTMTYQHQGGGWSLGLLLTLVVLSGLWSFPHSGKWRLPVRFYFFFGLCFALGVLCFCMPRRFFALDLLEGLCLWLSFIFAYQTIMVFTASQLIQHKLGENS